MPVQKKKLKVLPNPWLYIDELGRPIGVVAVEQPTDGTFFNPPRYVGAVVMGADLISKAPKGAPLGQDVHVREFEFSAEPVEVDNRDYYRKRVLKGELIAADRESFVAAGGRPKDFEAHQKHLETKKTEAIAQFNAENGDNAFEVLGKEREERLAALKKAAADAEAEARKAEQADKAAPAAAPATTEAAPANKASK